MPEHPLNDALPAGKVEIRTSPGSVAVTNAAVFQADHDAAVHSLIERLFRLNAVQAVTLDREKTTVEIQYDGTVLKTGAALRIFADVLGDTRPGRGPADAGVGALLRPYLDRIPGRVKRVERRRRPPAELTAATLAEAGIAVPSAGGIDTIDPGAAGEIVARIPADLAPESTMVMEDLIVEFDPAAEVSRAAAEAGPLPADVSRPWVGEVVIDGVRRMVNLAAAGGCFVMSIVGFITPGIPTVPFVLATGYFLARSSPKLHQRFRRSRIFGQMVSDYEDHGGLRGSTKFKMILLTVGLMVVTIVIAGASLPLLIVVGTMGTLGIYLLGRIPTLKGSRRPMEANLATA
jgi:uncharacterized membrane protein YbaN (DUF454 family)